MCSSIQPELMHVDDGDMLKQRDFKKLVLMPKNEEIKFLHGLSNP